MGINRGFARASSASVAQSVLYTLVYRSCAQMLIEVKAQLIFRFLLIPRSERDEEAPRLHLTHFTCGRTVLWKETDDLRQQDLWQCGKGNSSQIVRLHYS